MADKNDDPRLDFLYQYLSRTSKLKPDKFLKMLATEDFKVKINYQFFFHHQFCIVKKKKRNYQCLSINFQDIIIKFFNTPDENILTFQISSAGILIPNLGIIAESKVKSSYFLRRESVDITDDNYRDVLIPGDLSPHAIDEFALLLDNVCLILK